MDVPLAEFDAGEEEDEAANVERSKPILTSITEAARSVFLPVMIGAVVIALLVLVWLILLKRRRKKNT